MEQPNIPPRISMQRIYEDLLATLNLEKGMLFTIRGLTFQPGKTLRNFLFTAERKKHIKPLSFLILSVSLGTFLTLKYLDSIGVGFSTKEFIKIDANTSQKLKDTIAFINNFIHQYFHLFQMLKVPFYALTCGWFFRKKQYNYAERLVANCFIMAYATMIYIVFMPLAFIHSKVMILIPIITVLYTLWAFVQFFDDKTWKGGLRAIGSYLLGDALHGAFLGVVIGLLYLFG